MKAIRSTHKRRVLGAMRSRLLYQGVRNDVIVKDRDKNSGSEMNLTSPDFAHGTRIPSEFTCDGANLSPAFAWAGIPDSAQSLLLSCHDPDAPGGTFHHWVVYGIPAQWSGLKAGFGAGSPEIGLRQAVNDFGRPGYGGPCPPRGHGVHHYHFRLSALSGHIDAPPSARCSEIRRKAGPLEIAAAELIGLHDRP
jgi:hypothetical protein